MSNFQLSIQFFLQFAVILAACRVVGVVVRRFGQPQVVGEMIAGVVLGPSLFGYFAPGWHEALFPAKLIIDGAPVLAAGKPVSHPLMTVIYCFAQVGLACYMFLVGVEFRADLIRKRVKSAAAVSLAGILAPFILGAIVAVAMRGNPALFKPEVQLWENVLFLGAAMSITAFPMLARIIYERGLSGTSLGTLALTAGSIDDAAAWCVLAIVLASFKSDPVIAALAIGGGIVYAVAVLTIGRGLLARMIRMCSTVKPMRGFEVPLTLVILMAASWYTDYIGIYAVFGAFILGAAVPRGEFAGQLQRKLEPAVVNLLLPMFFVYSGLNTRITLVNTPQLWAIAGLLLAVAIVGKGAACYFAARFMGEPHREAMAIGALMNSRGLMELIILNIGRDFGIITDELFSMMVVMAIVTTLMATPIFELVYGRDESRAAAMRNATAA
jgi:Kef-type K+ transport system membrane component KefB